MLVTHTFYSIDLFVTFLLDDGGVVFQYRLLPWNFWHLWSCVVDRPEGGQTQKDPRERRKPTTPPPHDKIHNGYTSIYIYIYNIYGIVASIYIIYWLWRKSCTYIDNNITTFSLSRCWIFGFPTIYIYTKKFILRSWWTDRLLILVKIVGNIYNIVSLLLLHLLLLL